jgi:hypothetical protein
VRGDRVREERARKNEYQHCMNAGELWETRSDFCAACKFGFGDFSPLLSHPELRRVGLVYFGEEFTEGAVSSLEEK